MLLVWFAIYWKLSCFVSRFPVTPQSLNPGGGLLAWWESQAIVKEYFTAVSQEVGHAIISALKAALKFGLQVLVESFLRRRRYAAVQPFCTSTRVHFRSPAEAPRWQIISQAASSAGIRAFRNQTFSFSVPNEKHGIIHVASYWFWSSGIYWCLSQKYSMPQLYKWRGLPFPVVTSCYNFQTILGSLTGICGTLVTPSLLWIPQLTLWEHVPRFQPKDPATLCWFTVKTALAMF